MVEALKRGGKVVGAAPYTDTNPKGQMDRVFEMAREFDIDVDMHLDFGPSADDLDLLYVCELTDKHKYGGRVAIGHVTKLSAAPPEQFERAARRMADAGVALTVLPSTDLYLMGRHMPHTVMRGVTAAHKLLHAGVNCSLSTNNVLNPFTPFGDCSLIRMANLYANICQVGARSGYPRMLQHDHQPLGCLAAPSQLRHRGRPVRRSGGARLHGARSRGRRARRPRSMDSSAAGIPSRDNPPSCTATEPSMPT